MTLFSRYLMRHVFSGFAAAAGMLIPLFTTFNLINELDDVSSGGYRWTQAVLVVLMTLPRVLVDMGPFIALLGGILGLGLLSKNLELTAIRTAGYSIFHIAMAILCAGLILTLALSALDEWGASPLQQRAIQLKNAALSQEVNNESAQNRLWARRDDEFATVKKLDKHHQPSGIEIFYYRKDLSLASYIYAENATIMDNGLWILHHVYLKNWHSEKEEVSRQDTLPWPSIFTHLSLAELTLPGNSFSVRQLCLYIRYLHDTHQPSQEFTLALWQKLGRPVLTLAMILLAIPFTFSLPRSPGLGSRLASGVIVGLLTYISYQIIVNLGLLLSLNAQLTTVAPPVLLLIIALLLVYRFDKRH
ncbi:LPS export ABC transporter permease LptG [Erwinia sp. AnSW2-5]|uniref:LPS export ABC transporter permease LptG n=1 Tax=Erwinia sp. AnSW2-5 TaxID=3367692 RepID=UPI003858C9E6